MGIRFFGNFQAPHPALLFRESSWATDLAPSNVETWKTLNHEPMKILVGFYRDLYIGFIIIPKIAGYFNSNHEILVGFIGIFILALLSLVLTKIPFQEVFRPLKHAQNTLSEGSWSTRV